MRLITIILLLLSINSYSQDIDDTWYHNKDSIMSIYDFKGVDWGDNIMNEENFEYLVEVLFNEYEGIYIKNIDILGLQASFIERYFDTCSESTREWFNKYKLKHN